MPKITKHNGPSIHSGEPDSGPTTASGVSGAGDDSGGEFPLAGNSSSISSESPETNENESSPESPWPVQSTENPSAPDQTGEDSTASSVGGNQTVRRGSRRRS